MFFGVLAASMVVPAFRHWPLLWLVPLTAYLSLVALIPSLRSSFVRWRFGQVTPAAIGATTFIVLASSAALIAFHYSVHPDMRVYGAMLPVQALGGVIAAGILFPLLNAVLEEAVFRGVFFDAAEPQWGRWGAIVITATLFGYAHRHGYPPGLFGAFLAGLYGLAMGWLRAFTGGIGLPIIAHIFADVTIFTLMVRSGCFSD